MRKEGVFYASMDRFPSGILKFKNMGLGACFMNSHQRAICLLSSDPFKFMPC
jgi:hypothetical protein